MNTKTCEILLDFSLVPDVCECTEADANNTGRGCGNWTSGTEKWCYLKYGVGISRDCIKRANAILPANGKQYKSYTMCACK